MLFHSLGVNDEVRYGGPIRPRSCAQFVIRLEVLEDRFLLSGASASGCSVVNGSPDLTSSALIGSVSPTPGTVSPPIQEVNAANGVASAGNVDNSTQNGSAAVPASQQQAPAATEPSDPQKNGTASGSSTAPNSAGQIPLGSSLTNAACFLATSGSANLTTSAGLGSGTSSQSSAGLGSGTSSQSSSMNFGPSGSTSTPLAASNLPPSISPPLPNPAGIPAGGIFRQVAANSLNVTVGVLHIDPVASDLSASGPAVIGSSNSALTVYTGQPASLAAQPAPNTVSFRVPRPSLLSPTDSSPRVVIAKTAATAARERAELPDITELALIERPVGDVSNAPESPDPEATDASLVTLTTSAGDCLVRAAWPAESDRSRRLQRGRGGSSATQDRHKARCLQCNLARGGRLGARSYFNDPKS